MKSYMRLTDGPFRSLHMSAFISACLNHCGGFQVRGSRLPRATGAVVAAVVPPLPYGSRERFENMPVGIFEVDPAAAIPLVDLVPLAATGIGPIRQVPFPNACEDLVEFGLGYPERRNAHIIRYGG